jgi:hypothetical protein
MRFWFVIVVPNIWTVPHFQTFCCLSLCHDFVLHFGDETAAYGKDKMGTKFGNIPDDDRTTVATQSISNTCYNVGKFNSNLSVCKLIPLEVRISAAQQNGWGLSNFRLSCSMTDGKLAVRGSHCISASSHTYCVPATVTWITILRR